MSQTDIEMEDAENPHHVSEQSPRDGESNLVDPSNSGEGGMSSCATAVTSNGGNGLDIPNNEDEEKNGIRSPVNDQVELDIKLEGTEHRQVVAVSNNENDMNIADVEDTALIKTLENGIDTKDEVSKPNAIEGEMNEEKLAVDVAEKAECEIKDNQNRLDQLLEHSTLGVELSAPQRENGDQTGTVQIKGEEVDVDVDSHNNEAVADDEGECRTQAECKLNGDGNMFGQTVERASDLVTPTEDEVKSEKASDFTKPTGEEVTTENNSDGGFKENSQLGVDLSSPRSHNGAEACPTNIKGEEMDMTVDSDIKKAVEDSKGEEHTKAIFRSCESDDNAQPFETTTDDINDFPVTKQFEDSSPNLPTRLSACTAGHQSAETVKSAFTPPSIPPMGKVDDETPEDQAAFLKELEVFHRERGMDFKQPKFYGQPLNCLKLWRLVIRMGGYDKVTASKFWKLVGESFHPPKTCTTVSWTFRIFYEKSLLEFERYKAEIGELQLPVAAIPEGSFATEGTFQASEGGSGSGRTRRDSAARAIQGWQPLTNGEAVEHVVKDKNPNNVAKREKNTKSSGSLKQKRPRDVEHPNKVVLSETPNQVASSIISIGSPAEWVKINVRKTHDCFEVYALVPGLLREEVRVQADPAGRVVITGQPEQADNPWGISPFKKVVSLPERIDPLGTSAVVSMHGRLFVRVPFEKQA